MTPQRIPSGCPWNPERTGSTQLEGQATVWVENNVNCPRKVRLSDTQSSWWCHQMEPFSASVALCVGNSPVTGEFPSQRPVKRSFDVLFDLRLNKRVSKQSRRWWFETPSSALWRHCNENTIWSCFKTLSSRQNCRLWLCDLKHWGLGKMAILLQTTFSSAFSWMKMHEFWLKFHWRLSLLNDPINNIPALVPIMAWRRPGAEPLSEPMMVKWTTHIYVTRTQWVLTKADSFLKSRFSSTEADTVIIGDGERRPVFAINGTVPGPTIVVHEGQEVRVKGSQLLSFPTLLPLENRKLWLVNFKLNPSTDKKSYAQTSLVKPLWVGNG